MKKLICYVVVIFFIATSNFTQAQTNNVLNHTFTTKQLQEDFRRMREQLEQNQPGLYAYTPKKEMDRYLDSLYASLTQPLTLVQFLGRIKPVLMKIRNGHNNIYASKEASAYARSKGKFLPLELAWVQGKLYVQDVYDAKVKVPPGSEIKQINGTPVKTILHKLLNQYSSPDGYNETFSRRRIARSFAFAYYWYINQTEQFNITYTVPKTSEDKTAKVPGMTFEPLRAKMLKARAPKKANKTSKQMLGFELLNDQTALLRVSSFSRDRIKKGGQRYKKFLRKTFKTIQQKQIKNLILDVRGNGGGDDGYGNLLFSYLTNRPFNYYKYVETKISRIEHPEYYEDKREIRAANKQFESSVNKIAPNKYHLKENEGLGRFKPKSNAFTGNLYILINGGCFSATGEFVACAHYNKRGVFVGEEAGGNYYQNTSGAMLPLILPHSKLRVVVTIMKYAMDVSGYPKGRGVMPDYKVEYTINDLLQGNDKDMQKALKLIEDQVSTNRK